MNAQTDKQQMDYADADAAADTRQRAYSSTGENMQLEAEADAFYANEAAINQDADQIVASELDVLWDEHAKLGDLHRNASALYQIARCDSDDQLWEEYCSRVPPMKRRNRHQATGQELKQLEHEVIKAKIALLEKCREISIVRFGKSEDWIGKEIADLSKQLKSEMDVYNSAIPA